MAHRVAVPREWNILRMVAIEIDSSHTRCIDFPEDLNDVIASGQPSETARERWISEDAVRKTDGAGIVGSTVGEVHFCFRPRLQVLDDLRIEIGRNRLQRADTIAGKRVIAEPIRMIG